MKTQVLTVKLHSDQSLVSLRDRCRQVGELFGLETLPRTRLVTAVSEIGRNALQYANGAMVTFQFGDASNRPGAQSLVVRVSDNGGGLPVTAWSQGRAQSASGGIAGSQRLVDVFSVEGAPGGGTTVTLEMLLARNAAPLSKSDVDARMDELVRRRPQSPREEVESQNREMLFALEELRQRQAELLEADTRKDEFLAMLAHELRNPLAAIALTVAVMRRKAHVPPDDLARYRDAIGRQTEQLTRLINDLMDVSRVARGKVDLQKGAVAVDALLEHSVEMTQSFVEAKAHRLVIETAAEPLWVHVDAARIKQVLSNLIHNASRYTPAGGRVTVTARRRGDEVEIVVADDGIGIEPAMLTKIFDLFTQANPSLAREDAGLGVGLTLSHRLVTDHGGTLHAESDGLGKGSRFVVRLPLAEGPPADQTTLPAGDWQMLGKRLLLIDDNIDATLAIAESLRMSGFECVVAHDGESGLATGLRERPHGAIVDIGLPGIDGLEVARRLRQHFGESIRLVALSGYSSDDVKARAVAAGFDAFFVKPVDLAALTAQL